MKSKPNRRRPQRRVVSLVLAAPLALVGCNVSVSIDDGGDAASGEVEPAIDSDAGWSVLFDGDSLEGWRGYRMEGLPAGWAVADGAIHFSPPEAGERADLMTEEQFSSFELELEWAVAEGGNSGVFFHVSEDYDRSYHTGPEYQILDNGGHRDGEAAITSAGSNYALHPPSSDVTRPLGDFNEARIVVDGDRVEHWLNGTKLLEYILWDDDWRERVAASKFNSMPGYGLERTGYIALQDHGDEIWFRNIRIRTLR